MKEKTLNKIIEDIDEALWHLKNEKCNVDTKEKSWETYYGLDNELIEYIRKIEKENKELEGSLQTYEILLKTNIEENQELKDIIDKANKEIKELYELYKDDNCYTIGDKLENVLLILKGDKQ